MDFNTIWDRIITCAGQEFYTKTKRPFTYRIRNNAVIPDRTNYPISKSNFEKAAVLETLTGPGMLNNLVRGPAYVYAILTDERVRK